MEKRENDFLGIFLMIVGIFFFTATDVGLKWYVQTYSTAQVFFLRCVFSFIPILIFVFIDGGLKNLRSFRPYDHALRALFDSFSLLAIIIAFALIPILDAMAIAFTAPIMVMALSVSLLDEKVGIMRWVAAIVGFIGALFIIKPGAVSFSLGSIAALISALFLALALIYTRRLSWTESSSSIAFWSALLWVIGSGLFVPFSWKTPSTIEWIGFCLTGISGGLAQIFISLSLKMVSPNTVAPYKYTSLIWAAAFGFIFWGDIPDSLVVIGVTLIVGSGLFILYRESLQNRKKAKMLTSKIEPTF